MAVKNQKKLYICHQWDIHTQNGEIWPHLKQVRLFSDIDREQNSGSDELVAFQLGEEGFAIHTQGFGGLAAVPAVALEGGF
jgi:hypothetical protein